MTAANLPIEELRQRLAQIPLQGESAAEPEAVYRELIGFVPPCADARDAATLDLPGANRGDEFLTALAEREREDRVAGAVAAYA
jgi:hypothetical protein